MIRGVIHQTVVGKEDAVGIALALGVVAVGLVPLAALLAGQQALVVAEAVAADGFAGGDVADVIPAGVPAQGLGFLLGDEVVRQLAVLKDVVGDVLGLNDRPGGGLRGLRPFSFGYVLSELAVPGRTGFSTLFGTYAAGFRTHSS